MAKSKAQKDADLAKVKSDISKSKAIVFTDYKGMKVGDLESLRRGIKEQGGNFAITKSTLAEIAFGDKATVEQIVNKAALAMAYGFEDEVTIPKAIKAITKKNPSLKILGGFADGKFLTKSQIEKLADIPSKEELIAKLLGVLQNPGTKLVRTINNPASGLVRALKAISEKTA
ncbi:MAG: 50S ribosomal protein L10 [Patescibacteria group bacterium]